MPSKPKWRPPGSTDEWRIFNQGTADVLRRLQQQQTAHLLKNIYRAEPEDEDEDEAA
jgi:hypothetical protein